MFGIFEILKIKILKNLFVFLNMETNGSENFKMLLLLQIATKSFQTCPEFSSQWSSQNNTGDSWNIEFPIFNDFFFRNLKFTVVACGEIKNFHYLENEWP